MRITRFRVENFKSIGPAVELTELGPVNVLHGANNAGKSNVLEAMGVALRVLERLPDILASNDYAGLIETEWVEILTPHYPEACLTNRSSSEDEDREVSHPIEIELQLKDPDIELHIQVLEADRMVYLRGVRIGGAFYQNSNVDDLGAEEESQNYVLREHQALHLGGPLTQSIRISDSDEDFADRLFEAEKSRIPGDRDRWRALVKALEVYAPEIQGARLTTVKDDDTPGLAFEDSSPPHDLAPLEEQGQGIQAVVRVLGEIFLTDADIIALEEPESYLSLSGQLRLREVLERVARDYNKQIFLTSHSFAFDCGEAFWRVTRDDQGFTRVERAKRETPIPEAEWSEKLEKTMRVLRDRQSPPLPAAWLSREGLVLLPDRVREQLHLDHLDILYFVTNPQTGRVELWTGDEILAGFKEPT